LICNSIALYFLGTLVESLLGRKNFLLLFLLCGMGSSIASYCFELSSLSFGAGASGAIYGLLGAIISLLLRWKTSFDPTLWFRLLRNLILWLLFLVIFSFYFPNIGKISHLSGWLIGFLLGFLIWPRKLDKEEPSWLSALSSLLLLGLLFFFLFSFAVSFVTSSYQKNPSSRIRYFSTKDLKKIDTPYFSLSLPTSFPPPREEHQKDILQYTIVDTGPVVVFKIAAPLMIDLDSFIEQFFMAREREAQKKKLPIFKIPREDRLFPLKSGKKLLGKKFGYGLKNKNGQWIINKVEILSTASHFYIFTYSRLEDDERTSPLFALIQNSLVIKDKD
ncbi:MAG: rhomboid family intramembrane serine protease, partial [Planctomycetota bacterium]